MEDNGYMENMERFTINEFAKVCKTTKDTLYHYEKNGILSPTIDETNHYRYYTCLDFHRFQFISHLKNLGFTISEIREYQKNRSTAGYISLLEKVQMKTQAEIESLSKRLVISNYTRETMLNYQNCLINMPSIINLKESYYFLSPFNGNLNSLKGIKEMSDHLEQLLTKPSQTAPVVAIKIAINNRDYDNIHPIAFVSKTTSPEFFEKDCIYYRPAGQYLQLFLNLDMFSSMEKNIGEGYEKMAEYAEKHNYHFTTDLFCINRINRFYTSNPEEFLMELIIGLE